MKVPHKNSNFKEVLISTSKSRFSTIPQVGGMLDSIIFELQGKLKNDRVNIFIDLLSEYFDKKGEKDKYFDIEYLKTEDFIDTFEDILRRVIKTSSESKLRKFKQILVNQINTNSKPDFTTSFLDLILNLHEKQIQILNAHYEIIHILEEREKLNKINNEINEFKLKMADEKLLAEKGKANSFFTMQKELPSKLLTYVKLEEKIKSTEVVHKASHYDLSEKEFLFLVQDMIGKALLTNYSAVPYKILMITIYGETFIDFIKEQNGA